MGLKSRKSSSFHKHFPHRRSTRRPPFTPYNSVSPSKDWGRRDWIPSHAKRHRPHQGQWPLPDVCYPWVFWPSQAFGAFSEWILRWCAHGLIIFFQASRPASTRHIHKFPHFPRRHKAARSMTNSGRGSIGNDSFRGGTTDCNFGFDADPRFWPFSELAYKIIINADL